jgi:hypothetical protein
MHEQMRHLLEFPVAKVFPSIDLYRIYLLHPDSTVEFTKSDMGASQIANLLSFLGNKQAPAAVHMLTLRAMCNLFKN